MGTADAGAGGNTQAQVSKPWARRVGVESPWSYYCFSEYLAMGPARTLRGLVPVLGKKSGYVRQLERWSSQHDWQDRAADFDQDRIDRALALQPLIREDAMARLASHAAAASQVIIDLTLGQLGDDIEVEDVLNKHREVVGSRPAVPPSTRLQAAIRLHESLGIVPPKRIEHTGPDGAAIDMAMAYAQGLDPTMLDDLRKLAAKHAPTPDEIAAAQAVRLAALEEADETEPPPADSDHLELEDDADADELDHQVDEDEDDADELDHQVDEDGQDTDEPDQ